MSIQTRLLSDGRVHRRTTEAVLPTVRAVPDPRSAGNSSCSLLGWVLPLDDITFRVYSAGRVTEAGALSRIRSRFQGKLWHELSEAEHSDFPGDYEAQVGQGPITLHSEERLVTSDRGVGLLRTSLQRQLAAVAAGENPMGVTFDAASSRIVLEAGTMIETPARAPGQGE
jgi:hypothetical protein